MPFVARFLASEHWLSATDLDQRRTPVPAILMKRSRSQAVTRHQVGSDNAQREQYQANNLRWQSESAHSFVRRSCESAVLAEDPPSQQNTFCAGRRRVPTPAI